MKTILITGGTGFVASHLVEELYKRGERNIHLTSYRDEGEFVKQFVDEKNIYQINLTDYQATKDLIAAVKPDEIYHLASLASVGDSFEKRKFILEMNTNLQLNLLEAIKAHAPQAKLLHVSTALVYAANDNNQAIDEKAALGPDNPYALSKLIQDMMAYSFVKSERLNIVRVRPFNHIGERQTLGFVVADLAAAVVKVEKGEADSVKVGNLDSIRDFSDVKDVVNAYILIMEKGQNNEVYNIGSGQGHSIREVLDLLINLAKAEIKVEIDPNKIRPVDLHSLVCDNEKIVNLGWQQNHQLKETLERILNYWRENI
ncbi:GDP-mannose 4,6-dehydratase [Patescibacteria group bacterium]|nr:GDP-mannose 4,6-dehydratase [Patescibacteria group bacterium]